ncbi:RNA-binding protein RO60-like [Anopheles ziemanni]|uniref:RNA-binding protein RO60-like n=1 Tax=Anopheles coustani TaxID=139045 RepID=UPI002658D098|nr:RNA-binding protein RO60-like [Anopheles coustani]XP_058174522.1 RNA-binding protein RO60-like [Anopheles ziemanni]
METLMKTVQRFLYIGNDAPFFIDGPHTPLDKDVGKNVLRPIVKLHEHESPNGTEVQTATESKSKQKKKLKKAKAKAAKAAQEAAAAQEVDKATGETSEPAKTEAGLVPAQPESPILTLLKRTIKSNTIRRTDECLFALAYCAREFPTPEERHAAYNAATCAIGKSRDLFLFVEYYTELAVESGYAGFGHGIRNAITRWYDKHTPLQLSEILGKSTSINGWTHADVLTKAHVQLSCPEKASIIDAVRKRTSQLLAGKRTEKQKDKKAKQNATLEGEDKNSVPAMSEALQRYHTMRQFRAAPSVSKVLDYIKQHGMTIDMMPPHFLRSAKVWEAMFQTISYDKLMCAALRLQDFRLLNSESALVETYVAALEGRLNDLESRQIHPVAVHKIAMLYENNSRYESKKKELFHVDSPVNTKVLAKLWGAVEHSFLHHPKTGVRYYITLDLREAHAKKKVFRNFIISCFQASVMLAFSIYKREKDVTVMAFTEQADILHPVEFGESMSWLDAVAHCHALVIPKTKVSLVAPIARAKADKVKVDLFITITDSLIRVNPLRTPPYKALQDYREKVKLSLSRYAAISLSNHVPSFDFTSSQETTGILEMVGYNENTPKIIEAFAKNLFM